MEGLSARISRARLSEIGFFLLSGREVEIFLHLQDVLERELNLLEVLHRLLLGEFNALLFDELVHDCGLT